MFYLNSRSIILIEGGNTLEFLNRIVTADLSKIKDEGFIFSALLNSKGRFLCDFFVFLKEGKLFIDINKNEVEFFVNTIKYYDLLGELDFTIKPNFKVFAELSFLQNWKNRLFEGRFFTHQTQLNALSEEEFNLERIKLCLPDGSLELKKEKSIIMDYGYEEAGAMSFDKGCYLGQELMTRTKRVGEVRKALCCIKTAGVNVEHLSSFKEYSLILAYKKDFLNKQTILLKEGEFQVISSSFLGGEKDS